VALAPAPCGSTVIIEVRNELQLTDNPDALDWKLAPEQIEALYDASRTTLPHSNGCGRQFAERNPYPGEV
jgi:aryl-alcohol dehydrogenase-like predicted oxidoreductase